MYTCPQREADTFADTLLTRMHIYIYKNRPSVAATRWDVLNMSGFYKGFFIKQPIFVVPLRKNPRKFTDSTPRHKSWMPLSCVIYKLLWLSHVTRCTGTRCSSGLWLLETSAILVLVRAPPESGNEISLSVNDLFFGCDIGRYALYSFL